MVESVADCTERDNSSATGIGVDSGSGAGVASRAGAGVGAACSARGSNEAGHLVADHRRNRGGLDISYGTGARQSGFDELHVRWSLGGRSCYHLWFWRGYWRDHSNRYWHTHHLAVHNIGRRCGVGHAHCMRDNVQCNRFLRGRRPVPSLDLMRMRARERCG